MDAKAAWDEFKPFHCEIGVVRTTNSGITSPQISTAAADRAWSSWSALDAPAAIENESCVVRSNPTAMNGALAVSVDSTWYATARAVKNSFPDRLACSHVAKTAPMLSDG